MKIVIAIDSFKGSLSSMQAGNACKRGIERVVDADIVVKPLADGGEGTTNAFVEGLGARWVTIPVMRSDRMLIQASYAILEEKNLAIIEMAAAAGLMLGQAQDVTTATSYGVGEMIADAARRGCKQILIGIGGSATNDCGLGMLTALGARFLDAAGNAVGIGARDLAQVHHVELDGILPEVLACDIQVACDVSNPLCGAQGASHIYGPQKGLQPEQIALFDGYHRHFAERVACAVGEHFADAPGAGAAGGLGFALISCLGATLNSGIALVMRGVGLDDEMQNADYVITGEGKLDHQTSMGKAPVGIARVAKQYGATVIALAGSITQGAESCNENGVDAYFSITKAILPLETAMQRDVAERNLADVSEQIFRLILEEKRKHLGDVLAMETHG